MSRSLLLHGPDERVPIRKEWFTYSQAASAALDRKQTPFPCTDRDAWPHESVSLETNWIEGGPSFSYNPTKRGVMSWLPQPASPPRQGKNSYKHWRSLLLLCTGSHSNLLILKIPLHHSQISYKHRHNVPLYHHPQRSPLQHQRAPSKDRHRDCQGCR